MSRNKEELLVQINAIDSLPAFPDVLLRFQNEITSAEPDIQKLAQIVEDDPVLTAKLLKAVNSAYYSRTSNISSVSQAIARLGLVEVRRLAVTTAIVEEYNSFGGILPHSFWTHSVAVALASRAILEIGNHCLQEEQMNMAYLACLLHDIGIIVLFHLFEDDFKTIYHQQMASGGISILDELEKFGIDHGEAGAVLAKNWNLPPALYYPIQFHHSPSLAPKEHQSLSRLVHLADFVCNNIGVSRIETRIHMSFEESAFEEFELSLEQVPQIIENVKQQAQAAESLVNL